MKKTKQNSTKHIDNIAPSTHSLEVKAQNELRKTEENKFWPNDSISYSALTSFESCSICFYLKYFGKVKWPSTPKMELGSLVQLALNKLYEGKDYKTIIETIPADDREVAKKLVKQATLFDDIISIDSEYICDFGLGIPVKFIPDLLTENEIVENKYTGGYYNEKMAREQKQGDIYWYGVRQLLGLELPVKYQIFNNKKKTVSLVTLDKNIKDVTKTLAWMQVKIWQIKDCYEKNSWNTGMHGKWDCNLGKACPIKYPVVSV
jgi:hypothetical protein